MVNDSNQVQEAANDQAFRDEVLAWVRELETNPRARLKSLEALRLPKQYPGEDEGGVVAALLQRFSRFPTKQKRYVGLLRSLQRLECRRNKGNARAQRRVASELQDIFEKMEKNLGRVKVHIWRENGRFQIVPASFYGLFVHNGLTLFEKSRLNRIRQCQHCGTWFFARINHQKFCNDPEKKCQFAHYHTPEWRKQNRERNLRYQREHRKWLFEKRRR